MEVVGVSDKALIARVEKLLAAELAVARGGQFVRSLHAGDHLNRRDLARRLAPFYATCSRKQQDTLGYVESMSGVRLDENITLDQTLIFVEALRRYTEPGSGDEDIPL